MTNKMPYSAKVVQLTFNLQAHVLISMKKGQIQAFLTVSVYKSYEDQIRHI